MKHLYILKAERFTSDTRSVYEMSKNCVKMLITNFLIPQSDIFTFMFFVQPAVQNTQRQQIFTFRKQDVKKSGV